MMCRLAGCEGASWRQLFRRLAELIDPDGAEAGCDRNALLSLADELDRHADMAAGHMMYAARFDFAGWARRIREAAGR